MVEGGATGAQGVLRLLLLGQPHLALDDVGLKLPTRKALALLSYLALEGPTPRAKLIDLLWDQDEESARRNLRRELYRLRETPVAAHLASSGELLSLRDIWVDARAFLERCEAEPEAAVALYRGELLSGVMPMGAPVFSEWLEQRREAFARAYQGALQRLAAQHSARGEYRQALHRYQQLLVQDALQETIYRELMRLHYLLGEREAALAHFARCEALLQMELGLAPLPETLLLAEQIRAAAPLAEQADEPLTLGRLKLPFVGREVLVAQLKASSAVLTVIMGEAGVGKSRLVAETCRPEASLWLRAAETAAQTPFYMVTEALRAALTDAAQADRLTALDAMWRQEVARLLPELGGAKAASDSSEERRSLLLEALSRALLALSAGDGAIIFDDIHWADPSSLELLAHLARRRGDTRVRLLATARSQELRENRYA